MSAHWISAGRPSVTDLDELLARAGARPVSYDHIGSTLDPDSWPERSVRHEHLELGRGTEAFDAARDGLRSWACHRGIRARVHPADAVIEIGTTLLVLLPAGPFSVVVPDRVVGVVDEPTRFGFAYGTIAGHQERGEEAFMIELLGDGSVRATISVDAVAATTAARLVAPAVGVFQRVAVSRYLGALRGHVDRHTKEQE